jgi:hypothetical protein
MHSAPVSHLAIFQRRATFFGDHLVHLSMITTVVLHEDLRCGRKARACMISHRA